MNRKHRLVLFTILSLMVLGFIFGNSLQSRGESSARSSGIADLLRPLFDPFGRISDVQFHHLIRKLAHFTEFAALGFCLIGLAVNTLWIEKKQRWVPALLSLATAVADETIQYFTGRACMIRDVLLDFSGALFGILLMWLILWGWKHIYP